MNTFIIIESVIALILALSASAAVFYLAGINQMQRKFIVSSARREKRLAKQLKFWQTFVVRKSGLGALDPRVKKDTDEYPAAKVKVVAPSEAIAEAKRMPQPRILARELPKAVRDGFLGET